MDREIFYNAAGRPQIRTCVYNREASYMIAWHRDLPKVFEEMHGYSLFEKIDSIFSGDTDRDKLVRVNFYEAVSKMTSENYFAQINDWCVKNGVDSSGHLLFEERLSMHVAYYGDMMKCFKNMSLPGCDILSAMPDTILSEYAYTGNYMAYKFAVSATRNIGKTKIFIEFNPYNWEPRFLNNPYEYSMGALTLSSFWGVNKYDMLNVYNNFTAEESIKLNEYVGRMNVILENAVPVSEIGIFYPIATMQSLFTESDTCILKTSEAVSNLDFYYNGLCKAMFYQQLDYTILDDDSIASATLHDGKMHIGNCVYSVVLMPYANFISKAVIEKLYEFELAGGNVLWIGSKPDICSRSAEQGAFEETVCKFKNVTIKADSKDYTSVIDAVKDCISYGNVTIKADSKDYTSVIDAVKDCISYGIEYNVKPGSNLFMSPYRRDGKSIVFVANSGESAESFEIGFGDGVAFDIYNPDKGTITSYNGMSTVECAGYRGLFAVTEQDVSPYCN